jgi:hypothetical protein
VKKVKGSNPPGMDRGSALGSFNDDGWRAMERKPGFYTDAQGVETINSWTCSSECPVLALDSQSGTLKSGAVESHHMRNNSKNPADGGYHGRLGDMPLMGYGDSGGASRFFPQFANDAELDAWLSRLMLGPGQAIPG